MQQNFHFWWKSMQSQTLSDPSHQTIEPPKGNQSLAVINLFVSKMAWNIFKHLNFRLTPYVLISEWNLMTGYKPLKNEIVIRMQLEGLARHLAAAWSYESKEMSISFVCSSVLSTLLKSILALKSAELRKQKKYIYVFSFLSSFFFLFPDILKKKKKILAWACQL